MIGLYHVASFINHDCDHRNVTVDWLEEMGNNIVIRALKDIAQGEEITQWYFEPQNSQSYRYGIMCNCKYCMATAKEIEVYFKKLALYGNETTNSLVKTFN
jgi:SET domain-containing protein